MTPIEQVLNKWIELGAEMGELKFISRDFHGGLPNLRFDGETPMECSPNDILYGEYNIWEVMFPGDEKADFKFTSTVGVGYKYTSHIVFHKMQSVIQKDPRKYILYNSKVFND